MKFIVVLYICFAAFFVDCDDVFENACDPNDWVLNNIAVKWNNNVKKVTGELHENQKSETTVYKIVITVGSCVNQTSCKGAWSVDVNNETCESPTEDLQVPCKAAKEAAQLELEKEFITQSKINENLNSSVFCLNIEDEEK